MRTECQIPRANALGIWLPDSHAPSCIVTTNPSRTGLNPLNWTLSRCIENYLQIFKSVVNDTFEILYQFNPCNIIHPLINQYRRFFPHSYLFWWYFQETILLLMSRAQASTAYSAIRAVCFRQCHLVVTAQQEVTSPPIMKAKPRAPGPDGIHSNLLKHLPEDKLKILKEILNKIWISADFPQQWRVATVIPIPKPNKDHTDLLSYDPLHWPAVYAKFWSTWLMPA